jgi:hypothetical protein
MHSRCRNIFHHFYGYFLLFWINKLDQLNIPMNRETLNEQANAHLREQDVRLRQAFDNGRRFEQNRIRRTEWRKLFGVVVAGSVIGCGIILAVAVGLSNIFGQTPPAPPAPIPVTYYASSTVVSEAIFQVPCPEREEVINFVTKSSLHNVIEDGENCAHVNISL